MRGRVFQVGSVAVLLGLGGTVSAAPPADPAPGFRFPTVPAEHRHARALLANAVRYADPAHKLSDPASGYPFEGWNQDPDRGLFLRSFTQLTAIGLWMEMLAEVAAGRVETPFLPRDKALEKLAHVARTLRHDQKDPQLGAKGLLGNFIDLAGDRRLGPLTPDVSRRWFTDTFGPTKGEAIWKALTVKGWLIPRGGGDEAAVKRGVGYGDMCFDGALEPYCDEATKKAVMAVLDRRTVQVVFGDNANLTASAGRVVGALLHPALKDDPTAAAVRQELDQFLDDQRPGYAHLFDPKAGLFYFGWDGQRDRLFGWEGADGKWKTGHSDYLVNEFRGPTTFVVLRHGLPVDAVANLGFKAKPYRLNGGDPIYSLAPWEGSAFQVLGLSLSFGETGRPGWRELLPNAVAVQADYATRHRLPGFLSESYTGVGNEYTGAVGVPDVAVNPKPRVTDAPSLYTLGVAYHIAPDRVERFLAANWEAVAPLLTDHGPWEGTNVTQQAPVRFQTTAHTLSLALGLVGTGSENMARYLASRGLDGRLGELFPVAGGAVDFLSADVRSFAWAAAGGPVRSGRDGGGFRVAGERAGEVGIAFVPPADGASLSGGVLSIRYRAAGEIGPVTVALKPAAAPQDAGRVATELYATLDDTRGREAELRIPLPATPGLSRVKEVVFTLGRGADARPLDLTLTHLSFAPDGPPTPTATGPRK